jgi:hypothetical protein
MHPYIYLYSYYCVYVYIRHAAWLEKIKISLAAYYEPTYEYTYTSIWVYKYAYIYIFIFIFIQVHMSIFRHAAWLEKIKISSAKNYEAGFLAGRAVSVDSNDKVYIWIHIHIWFYLYIHMIFIILYHHHHNIIIITIIIIVTACKSSRGCTFQVIWNNSFAVKIIQSWFISEVDIYLYTQTCLCTCLQT